MLLRVHRTIGLAFALVLILTSTTGSLLVMHHELERMLENERHAAPRESRSVQREMDPADIVRLLAQRAPEGYRPLRIEPGASTHDADKYLFVAPDRTTRWAAFIQPGTGVILWSGADQDLFTPWLLHLHMHFHVGRWGYVAGGVVGCALLALSVSGFFVTRKRRATLVSRPIGGHHPPRVAASRLHRWLGLALIYFTFVLGATGVWFAIRIIPGQFANRAPVPTAAFEPKTLAPIAPILAAAESRFPQAELFRVAFPSSNEGVLVVTLLHRSAPVWRKFSRMEFDPRTARLDRTLDAAQLPWEAQLASILAPLHFGFYGSSITKYLYAIGGLAPGMLAITGLLIARRRRQVREASQRNARRVEFAASV